MDALRDDLVRARPAAQFRAQAEGSSLGLLFGVFARFDEWTEIHSWYEGDFLEKIAKGAFAKTIKENRDAVKVLFDHGHDPYIGQKVLGPIELLEEQSDGAHYEVPLFDTAYNRELHPGLANDPSVYGASFRFRVIKDEWNDEPGVSTHNPTGLPERVIKEVRLYEFGPVTFPAYAGATAGLRSLTDEYLARRYAAEPDTLRRLADVATDLRTRPRAQGAAPAGTPAGDRAASTPQTEPPAALGMHPDERLRLLQIDGVITT